MPIRHQINYLFQKYVTRGVRLSDGYFYDRLEHAREHLKSYARLAPSPVPGNSLEIGTGWYPIVPIAFFLSGVERIYSVDISMLTSKERVQHTLSRFMLCLQSRQLPGYLSIKEERVEVIKAILADYKDLSLSKILERLRISYLIEDARQLSLDTSSIDLVNSNNTFEHIYPEILLPILNEFKRIVKSEGGVMSHFIDMSDHFAHFDRSINIYNFLQFSDAQWKWIDNSIQPQSRCRIYEYRALYDQAGIPITDELLRKGSPEQLRSLRLDSRFRDFPAVENAVSHAYFASMMGSSPFPTQSLTS